MTPKTIVTLSAATMGSSATSATLSESTWSQSMATRTTCGSPSEALSVSSGQTSGAVRLRTRFRRSWTTWALLRSRCTERSSRKMSGASFKVFGLVRSADHPAISARGARVIRRKVFGEHSRAEGAIPRRQMTASASEDLSRARRTG